MPINPIFMATIEPNGLNIHQDHLFQKHLQNLNFKVKGEPVELVVRKARKKYETRSDQENKYYWGVVVHLMCEYTGDSAIDMHEILKANCNREDIKNPLSKIRSTADLTTLEFEQFLTRVRQLASEQGVLIPLPNQVEYEL